MFVDARFLALFFPLVGSQQRRRLSSWQTTPPMVLERGYTPVSRRGCKDMSTDLNMFDGQMMPVNA